MLYYIGYLVLVFLFAARSATVVEDIVTSRGWEVVDFWRYTDLTLGGGFAALHFLFISEFVDLKKHLPNGHQILMILLSIVGIFILLDWLVLFYFQNLDWSKNMERVGQFITLLTTPYILILLFKVNTPYAKILRKAYIAFLLLFLFIPMLFIYDYDLKISYAPNLFKGNFLPVQIGVIFENIIFIWLFVHRAKISLLEKARLQQELAVTEERSEHFKKMLDFSSKMITNISHEFRTPLTLIKAPLEDLLTSRQHDKEWMTFYRMHENAERLLNLVNQLLELSLLESGILKLENEPQEIYQFLRHLAGNFQSLAEQKQLTYKIKIPKEKTILSFDKDKLEKTVLNFLSNALKFSPEKGWVVFKANFSKKLILEIGNNGTVIPKQEQTKIFDRFYQAGDTRHQGAGIGLALAKEFVDLYDGKISVTSDETNGTWFKVELPLEKIKMQTIENQEIVFPIPSTLKTVSNISNDEKLLSDRKTLIGQIENPSAKLEDEKPLLLIVEDHEEVRQYIHSKLENNFKILEAENGQLGWELATEHLPDLIISDLMMPVMDGISFCKKIKKDIRTDHIPFILLTAKVDIDSRLEGLEIGADDYLEKPFNSQELIVRSKNLIVQRKKVQERFQQKIELQPSPIHVSSAEEKFLKKVISFIETNLNNTDLSVDDIAKEMNLSRTHLYRKLKAISGMSPSEFIRNFRLEKAAQLIKNKTDTISQIAFQVGFSNPSYFSKCFKEKYNIAPSAYKTPKIK